MGLKLRMVRRESGDVIISSGVVIGMDRAPFRRKLKQVVFTSTAQILFALGTEALFKLLGDICNIIRQS